MIFDQNRDSERSFSKMDRRRSHHRYPAKIFVLLTQAKSESLAMITRTGS